MKQLILLFTLLFSFFSDAQQEPVVTQFWNNYSFINPATCAMDFKHQASVLYRNQWDRVNGAPNTVMANYNYEINRNHAVGVNFMHEAIGVSRINVGVLNYNYRFHFSDSMTHFLSVGAGIGMGNHFIDYEKFYGSTINVIDLAFPNATTNYPKVNVGVAYRFKKLFVGIGSTQVTEAFLARSNTGNPNRPARHYYLMSSYDFRIVENFSLKPQLLVQTDGIFSSVQLNVLAAFFKNYSIGASVRSRDAFAFIAQVDIVGKFRVGYSYDYTTNKLAGISKGTHEVVLGFQLSKKTRNGIRCNIPRKKY